MVKWKIKERGHGRFVVEVIGEPGSRILARDKSEFIMGEFFMTARALILYNEHNTT